MKKLLNSAWFKLLLPIFLYCIGAAFVQRNNIDRLKYLGCAEQEEYTYVDRDGEIQEGESLIKIDGLGKILTYKDVYISPIYMFVLALMFGAFMNEGYLKGEDQFRYMIFANCIIGIFLVSLTTSENWIATAFFWLGIVAAYFNLIVRYE